jgi:ABC-type antimicrobial peptide transport system permease subunit
MTVVGVGVGIAGSVAVARVLRSMLVGVPAVDLVTFGIVAVCLVAVAAVASLAPARRATEVSAMEALRGG